VLKPSELTPFSALALAVLAERVGFPKGVINIVTGQPWPIGEALTSSEIVRKLSFTGSTRVGRFLMEKSRARSSVSAWSLAATRRSSSLTMPISTRRLKGVMDSKFRNAGQTLRLRKPHSRARPHL
jgi:succinate-semialdehyde dehydrogenase/glutarate-semialdehyde dehydrogenase